MKLESFFEKFDQFANGEITGTENQHPTPGHPPTFPPRWKLEDGIDPS